MHEHDVPPAAHHHVASVGPKHHVLQAIVCMAAVVCCVWLLIFTFLLLLLHATNTAAVHTACPGLWDFALASLVFPFLSPVLFLLAPTTTSTIACPFIFTLLGVVVSLEASTHAQCVETLRAATPPLPWLLIVAWIKTGLFTGALVGGIHHSSSAAAVGV
jgi:hypothetical protein